MKKKIEELIAQYKADRDEANKMLDNSDEAVGYDLEYSNGYTDGALHVLEKLLKDCDEHQNFTSR